MFKITQLTSEQEALIPIYREKWCNIALSTKRIDKEQAVESIEIAYSFLGYAKPEILFFESTEAIARNIQFLLEERIANLSKPTKEPILKRIGNRLGKPFSYELQNLYRKLCVDIGTEYFALFRIGLNLDLYRDGNYLSQMYDLIKNGCSKRIQQEFNLQNYELKDMSVHKLKSKLEDKFFANIFPAFWHSNDCLFINYCHEVLQFECNLTLWDILKELCVNCGLMIVPFQSICLVCDRPTKILLDNHNCLYAEGEAAIEYADGFKIYAHHGLAVPKKYGTVTPSEWKAEWLLNEIDQRLKKILREELDNREK